MQGDLQRLQEIDHTIGRSFAVVTQDVLATTVRGILLGKFPAHSKRFFHRRDVHLIVIEHGECASLSDRINRTFPQFRILPFIETERELGLIEPNLPSRLNREERKFVCRFFLGSTLPSDDEAIVIHVVVSMHEPPKTTDHLQGLFPAQNPLLQVRVEERAQGYVEAPIVPGSRMQGVEPKQLNRLPKMTRRIMANGRQRFSNILRSRCSVEVDCFPQMTDHKLEGGSA